MNQFHSFISTTNVAQIVRPFDPNALPPVTAEEPTQSIVKPLIGLIAALTVVTLIIVFTIRKKRSRSHN